MGAIVTIRIPPGEDPEQIRAKVQSALAKTGEQVTIRISATRKYPAQQQVPDSIPYSNGQQIK